MLNADDMSDAAADKKDDKDAAASKGGGNKKLLIIALAVNLLLAGGLGYVVMSGHDNAGEAHGKKAGGDHESDDEEDGEEDEADGDEDEEGDGEEGHAKGGKFGPLLEVGSFVANLATAHGEPPRYAKVTVHVEASSEAAKERVEAALVPIKTEALMLLSNARPEDVIGQDKIVALSQALLKRANKLIGKKAIKRVYFSELVIQ